MKKRGGSTMQWRYAGVLPVVLALAGCGAPKPAAAPLSPAPSQASSPPAATAAPLPAPAASPSATLAPGEIAIRGERGHLAVLTLDNKTARLSDFGGEVTVIAIWGTTCVPCIRELPFVEAAFQSYRGDRRVAFIALALDDFQNADRRKSVKDTAMRLGVTMPVLIDENIGVYRRLNGEDGPNGKPHTGIEIPELVIIDRGFRRHRRRGFKARQNQEEFVNELRGIIDAALRGELPPEPEPAAPAAPSRPAGDVAMR